MRGVYNPMKFPKLTAALAVLGALCIGGSPVVSGNNFYTKDCQKPYIAFIVIGDTQKSEQGVGPNPGILESIVDWTIDMRKKFDANPMGFCRNFDPLHMSDGDYVGKGGSNRWDPPPVPWNARPEEYGLPIVAVLHVGDVVDGNGPVQNTNGEWLFRESYLQFRRLFDGSEGVNIPVAVSMGNHDYDQNAETDNRCNLAGDVTGLFVCSYCVWADWFNDGFYLGKYWYLGSNGPFVTPVRITNNNTVCADVGTRPGAGTTHATDGPIQADGSADSVNAHTDSSSTGNFGNLIFTMKIDTPYGPYGILSTPFLNNFPDTTFSTSAGGSPAARAEAKAYINSLVADSGYPWIHINHSVGGCLNAAVPGPGWDYTQPCSIGNPTANSLYTMPNNEIVMEVGGHWISDADQGGGGTGNIHPASQQCECVGRNTNDLGNTYIQVTQNQQDRDTYANQLADIKVLIIDEDYNNGDGRMWYGSIEVISNEWFEDRDSMSNLVPAQNIPPDTGGLLNLNDIKRDPTDNNWGPNGVTPIEFKARRQ